MGIDSHVTDPYLVSVIETSHAAKEQALALIDLVDQHTSADRNAPLDLEAKTSISKQQKLLAALLAHLRGLHRRAHLKARETKTLTGEARHELDVLHLQLQNLYYEQRHLEGEICACEHFNHTHQQLPLIPLQDFLNLKPEHCDVDGDVLMIARIAHEKEEREALEKQRKNLLKKKQELMMGNKKRRDDLANLDKDLEKFIDAAKPIQKMFETVA